MTNRSKRHVDDAYHVVGLWNYDLDVVLTAGALLRIAEAIDRLTAETRKTREFMVEYTE
jgi:hypothetical protein